MFGDETTSFPNLHGGWQVLSGEGQFEGAEGGGRMSGELVDFDANGLPLFETELTGTLTYPQ
jgi:hypothetical protein